MNFLEEEKIRLQNKLEKTMVAGKQHFGVTELKDSVSSANGSLTNKVLISRQKLGVGAGDHAG